MSSCEVFPLSVYYFTWFLPLGSCVEKKIFTNNEIWIILWFYSFHLLRLTIHPYPLCPCELVTSISSSLYLVGMNEFDLCT